MTKVSATWQGDWKDAWERDTTHLLESRAFVHLGDGELRWAVVNDQPLIDDDELEGMESNPMWQEIPPLTHSEHHIIFQAWRAGLPYETQERCNPISIGGFLEGAPELEGDWQVFHDGTLRALAEAWMARKGFTLDWRD